MNKQKKIIKSRPSSSITPKIYNSNKLYNNTQQNPKNNNSSRKKIFFFSNNPKQKVRQRIFSLLDINPKSISTGTSLPKQYERTASAKTIIIKPKIKLEKKDKNFENPCKIIENNSKKVDAYLPKGFTNYQFLIKNPKLFQKIVNSNSIFNNKKIKVLNYLEQKAKQNITDPFFSKPPTDKECGFNMKKTNNVSKVRNNYYDSDIFNLKNDIVNLKKSSEIYLFKNYGDNRYYITKESNSRWQPKKTMPTLYNCSSQEYNIVIPDRKNNTSSTKEKIMTECKNSVNKQKGLLEFYELSRSGFSQPCESYNKTYSNNINCFKKINQIGTTLYNSFLTYKDICQKPFMSDKRLKSL